MNKKFKQIYHFYARFTDRTGEQISMEDYVLLKDQILNGSALHVKKQSNRVSIKGVDYKGKMLLVVYDKIRKTLVTILPGCDPLYKKVETDNG